MPDQPSVPDKDPATRSSLVIVDDSELFTMRSRPGFFKYLGQLWQRRHFIIAEARSKSLNPGADMILGNLWLVLNPILDVAVYAFIFGVVLKTNRGIDNFIGFLVIGVIFFGFFNRSVMSGSGLIQNSRALITSFSFPKASLALSQFVRKLIDDAIPAIVAVVLALLSQIREPISWTIVLVVPLYFMLHLFGLGIMLIVARATAFMPDLKPIVSLILRMLFFCSGIFFSMEHFPEDSLIREIMELNPAYMFLMAIRDVTLYATVPDPETWGRICLWTFVPLIIGLIYFWAAEERYPRVQN